MRYYDPVAGRFVSRDPLGLWGDPGQRGNGQGYCSANPVNLVDPLGLGDFNPLDPLAELQRLGKRLRDYQRMLDWETKNGKDTSKTVKEIEKIKEEIKRIQDDADDGPDADGGGGSPVPSGDGPPQPWLPGNDFDLRQLRDKIEPTIPKEILDEIEKFVEGQDIDLDDLVNGPPPLIVWHPDSDGPSDPGDRVLGDEIWEDLKPLAEAVAEHAEEVATAAAWIAMDVLEKGAAGGGVGGGACGPTVLEADVGGYSR